MALGPFLAMTQTEMENLAQFPEKTAWLGCHFSPYGQGLSNAPLWLPKGSLLVLDDATPIAGHNPKLVASQLQEIAEEQACAGVLLDFQRPDQEEAAEMAAAIVLALPCPVAVSSLYAKELHCPVFLSPLPPSVPLKEHLWPDRTCWLELALDGETITVTEQGAIVSPLWEIPDKGFPEENLHCHYTLELTNHQAKWRLWRTREDVMALMEEADRLGVTQAVGLWQELV